MKMFYFILFSLLFCVEGFALNDNEKVEKSQQRRRNTFDWERIRPQKLSGDRDIDAYIQCCDTVWNQIQYYRETVTFFRLDTTYAQDAEGNKILVVKVADEQGNTRNFSKSIQQGAELVLAGSSVILDAANISLLTTNATLALVNNPLLAFRYGKCMQAGPNIVKLAYNEIREVVNYTKKQIKDVKSMKTSRLEGSTDQAYILPVEGELPPNAEIQNLDEIDLGSSDDEIDLVGLEDEIDLEELKEPEKKK